MSAFDKKSVDKNKWMIDPDDAVMLLIDHQSGLFQLVRDIDQPTLRDHAIALAKVAKPADIPTFTTASVPDGPNGPLIPEIHQVTIRNGSKPSRIRAAKRSSSPER